MSNKTFNMSTEHTVPSPQRELQQVPSSDSHYTNLSLTPSPDPNRSVSSMSDRESNYSLDVNMLDCFSGDGSLMDNPYTINLPLGNVLCGVNTNLNQTFIATPVNSSVNFWNENLTLMCNHEMGSEKYPTFSKSTEDGSNSAVISPVSERESQLGSCETSRRGSSENDCCSLSSGEMLMRNNSFCLEDQSLLVISSLEESSLSLPAGHPALSAESNLLSTILLDVCKKSPDKVIEENITHLCLGTTFTEPELQNEENDMVASNALVTLPSEKEAGLLMTFVCETSPADCGKEALFACADAQLFNFPETITPEQGKTFVSMLSAVQDTDKDIYTSTPIQNTANKIPSLSHFSESPCTGNTDSPGLNPVKQQQASTDSKHLDAELQPSASKVKKREIKKFPKSNFSSVKSKIVTRNGPQMTVPGSASQHKQSQVNVYNKRTELLRGASNRISPAKVRSSLAVSNQNKTVNGAQRSSVQGTGVASPFSHDLAANKDTSVVQCNKTSLETTHVLTDASAQPAGNQTFCLPSLEKHSDRSDPMDPKPTPKKVVSHKIEVRSGSALCQDKTPVNKVRLRCFSESSSMSSRLPKEKKNTLRFSTSFTIPKIDTHLGKTKPGNLKCSSQSKRAVQAEARKGPVDNSTREVKKISLVEEASKSTAAGPSLDQTKSRFRRLPSPGQTRGRPISQALTASPRPATVSTRQRQTAPRTDECRTSKVEVSKQKNSAGSHRARGTGEPSIGSVLSTRIKPQLNDPRPPRTPSRPSLMGHPPTPTSRIQHKTPGPSRSLADASGHTDRAGSSQVSGGAARKPTPFKTIVLKSRLATTPAKNTEQSFPTPCKPAASTSKGPSNPTISPLKRTASARFARPTLSAPVDKNKPKAGSRQKPTQQPASQPNQSNRPPDVVPASSAEAGRRNQTILQLRGLLADGNCRFEALAIVLQQALAERDEAKKQTRDLSQELVNLRGELVCSVHSSECLEKERDELRVALEDALQKLQEQHQKDMTELEQRLQRFYQAEWDKVHITYQDEADKCKTLMQQQLGELKANHEAMTVELENSHTEQLQCVKQQYEMSLEEIYKVHNQELQSLDKNLKDAEATLSGQIEVLTEENNALIEKLTAEENRRKALAERSQKDSHTVYLEQELDSLKVVLDIKNKQLHQQEKKLMEIDKLREKNVKLDESLQKVQQENEDLKARMDRHAALSRQLSTEQAVLQDSLQKESKVNKRLSMENEELLWKLHNGDLSSPRKVSPSSTSHSFSLQSPCSPSLLSSPPVSPR